MLIKDIVTDLGIDLCKRGMGLNTLLDKIYEVKQPFGKGHRFMTANPQIP
jgi:hypothetical protein